MQIFQAQYAIDRGEDRTAFREMNDTLSSIKDMVAEFRGVAKTIKVFCLSVAAILTLVISAAGVYSQFDTGQQQTAMTRGP